MFSTSELLATTPPEDIAGARSMAHNATQIAALAALANLAPRPDYSHTALRWNAASGAFETDPMDSHDGLIFIQITLSPLTMRLVRGGEAIAILELDDVSEADCLAWLDEGLIEHGLYPASAVKHPFKLPRDVADIDRFKSAGLEPALLALGRWYDLASRQLLTFASKNDSISPGPGPIYCWPHHFDIATYVAFETNGNGAARGVGVGMSPGDSSYSEPYFYVNPWPHLSADSLPPLPTPGHWHTDGFVGAVATASEVLTLDDTDGALSDFIDSAFAVGREKLRA
ncbi:hypothetical protein [Hoeflea prorocentri]|uniref:Uncharacterized protein n=1 Tax=Hoeflea prorocentri TaxID=1922333 RepID=A0A9X3ZGN9_9HYPH|nr:hypothetical protein [Hoeflea prorocentri]MCY6379935.1 hypothetical protein [Hoeflea prorocentri]MDA5397735.1 hypothetical protein [Hoeflea prorocentri]